MGQKESLPSKHTQKDVKVDDEKAVTREAILSRLNSSNTNHTEDSHLRNQPPSPWDLQGLAPKSPDDSKPIKVPKNDNLPPLIIPSDGFDTSKKPDIAVITTELKSNNKQSNIPRCETEPVFYHNDTSDLSNKEVLPYENKSNFLLRRSQSHDGMDLSPQRRRLKTPREINIKYNSKNHSSPKNLDEDSKVAHRPLNKPAVASPDEVATLQNKIKETAVSQMCVAVTTRLIGEKFTKTSDLDIESLHINPLYDDVYERVACHFRRMPPRYALSVVLGDVPMHMKLLAEASKSYTVAVHVRPAKNEKDGEILGMNEVMIVCRDMKGLLTAITVTLSSMGQSIVDADIVTTTDGFVVDRFMVTHTTEGVSNNASLSHLELKKRIEMQLSTSMELNNANNTEEVVTDIELNNYNDRNDRDVLYLDGTFKENNNNNYNNNKQLKAPEFNEDDWKIPINALKLKNSIGKGRSGTTYLATWGKTKVAAKMMDLNTVTSSQVHLQLCEFFQEVSIVSKLQHPNICRFLGASISPPQYCVVFEYMQGGDLYTYLRTKKKIDFFKIAQDVAQGVHYMHLSNFIHRDLKSGNLLLSKDGNVKVTDFGLSRFLAADGDMTAETGTYRWMSPEVIRHEPYTKAADVYSYGMVLYEMLTRHQPFKELTPVQAAYAVAKENLRPNIPPNTPKSITELVQMCWHQNPFERPTFEEILRKIERIKLSMSHKEMEIVCKKYV